ncbi:helicase-like protein, partial [Trifolium medium]|nr:helicase-like protein [Trifolium medium]
SRTVAEMFALGWGADGVAWEWRRQLRAWEEEMLGECYTVRGAYQVLISHALVIMGVADNLVWHPQVPLKVSIFAWRLLRDRLPTRVNLDRELSLGFSASMAWHSFGGLFYTTGSLYPVYIFSRCFSSASIIFTAHLACLYVGSVDGEKSSIVYRLSRDAPHFVGQDQAILL